ncbi:ANTAR domain-containing response regulator [Actinorugispora endophytica]|uniref:ANTAR domain-containing protein n=1 Tax=Actinorugispora endophytica TaxID=1605990 RepID=A0A4R6V3Y1_9ACTN|nr:ANTAR domain-containing protein [Actinorugispora endophytica]TDQ52899.1 ANTAR domain-containing protein [Actinorugispora endophytica]
MRNSRAITPSAVPDGTPVPVDDPVGLARHLVSLTEAVTTSADVEDATQRVAAMLTADPWPCDHVHVTVRTAKNAPPVIAYSDDVARLLGDCAGFLGDEPVLAVTLPSPDEATETRHTDGRWQRFLERAAEHGVRAIHAARMITSQRAIGVITLYSTDVETLERVGASRISTVIDTIALALEHRIEVANLTRALDTRSLIGTAIGILMERHRIGETDAWQMLSRTSQQLNIRLVDISRRIVDDTRFDGVGRPDREPHVRQAADGEG